MSTAYESATLLIRLYELRRDPTMREARTWYFQNFNPTSVDEVVETLGGPNSAHFRMVTSYWDMAASFVNHGAIDPEMFNDANGEHIFVYLKLEPYLAEYRAKIGNPAYLKNLEQLLLTSPSVKDRVEALRDRVRAMVAGR